MRNLSFPLDLNHAKSVNENHTEVRRLRISALIVAALLIAGAVLSFVFGSTWVVVLGVILAVFAVGAIFLSFWLPRQVGTLASLYAKGELVPAVIAEKRPRGVTLLALVNVSKHPDTDPRYALVTRSVSNLPGHNWAVGAKIPSAAVLGDRTSRGPQDVWQLAGPMPIAWGTRDRAVIARGIAEIPAWEWAFLARNTKRFKEVDAAPARLLALQARELPTEMR
ncbi:DUF3239 domain-containing protein [Rhodococcus sp. D2-41]|uniref:DUF3239 domain-containing protein n=1 Tax=Speluncibacter jeojiensis TaxID=2710754 RepID=A0A9X4RDT2_9ACTN|nr:DUF3239 domain-containing protein [Rhodococcus sp. D2-41]MDG3011728.1 DUF3239 domain-containing protein [Rhodococcus sp. D2-41]MDG3014918.1 DUF3239 domain-containing protein [Corynebacteriales bacterium D3-21]